MPGLFSKPPLPPKKIDESINTSKHYRALCKIKKILDQQPLGFTRIEEKLARLKQRIHIVFSQWKSLSIDKQKTFLKKIPHQIKNTLKVSNWDLGVSIVKNRLLSNLETSPITNSQTISKMNKRSTPISEETAKWLMKEDPLSSYPVHQRYFSNNQELFRALHSWIDEHETVLTTNDDQTTLRFEQTTELLNKTSLDKNDICETLKCIVNQSQSAACQRLGEKVATCLKNPDTPVNHIFNHDKSTLITPWCTLLFEARRINIALHDCLIALEGSAKKILN